MRFLRRRRLVSLVTEAASALPTATSGITIGYWRGKAGSRASLNLLPTAPIFAEDRRRKTRLDGVVLVRHFRLKSRICQTFRTISKVQMGEFDPMLRGPGLNRYVPQTPVLSGFSAVINVRVSFWILANPRASVRSVLDARRVAGLEDGPSYVRRRTGRRSVGYLNADALNQRRDRCKSVPYEHLRIRRGILHKALQTSGLVDPWKRSADVSALRQFAAIPWKSRPEGANLIALLVGQRLRDTADHLVKLIYQAIGRRAVHSKSASYQSRSARSTRPRAPLGR